MKGYVQNKSTSWTHAMKRSVRPGEKISLDVLYRQYGEKHGLSKGSDFVEWLRSIKLRDAEKWIINFEDERVVTKKPKEVVNPIHKATKDSISLPIKELEVKDIVGLSVRKSREVVPQITDLKLLKYAIQEANQLSGKDSLCRILRKRVMELNIAR